MNLDLIIEFFGSEFVVFVGDRHGVVAVLVSIDPIAKAAHLGDILDLGLADGNELEEEVNNERDGAEADLGES